MTTFSKLVRSAASAVLLTTGVNALAALDIPGANGTDASFAPAASTVVDLSLAPTGNMNVLNGSGSGVYDPDHWAVIYRYTSVDIPAGVTVSFKNHPSGAPVVWLVSGDVSIAGTIDLGGQDRQSQMHSEPGPGGFRGGIEYINGMSPESGGFGPGGGKAAGVALGAYGTEGSWGDSITVGTTGAPYGNARILPLIGGSGGGGGGAINSPNYGGGAGGGALLIASTGTTAIEGGVIANGGQGTGYASGANKVSSGSGSGGAIRIVSDVIDGSGLLEAIGGQYTWNNNSAYRQSGGSGRIRIEANSVAGALQTYPQTNVVAPDSPVVIWPPAEAPSIKVVSVGSEVAPADPSAGLTAGQADMTLEHTTSSEILLETANVDPAANVTIRVVPKHGQPFSATAIFESGATSLATWRATITPPDGFFALQAQAINP